MYPLLDVDLFFVWAERRSLRIPHRKQTGEFVVFGSTYDLLDFSLRRQRECEILFPILGNAILNECSWANASEYIVSFLTSIFDCAKSIERERRYNMISVYFMCLVFLSEDSYYVVNNLLLVFYIESLCYFVYFFKRSVQNFRYCTFIQLRTTDELPII